MGYTLVPLLNAYIGHYANGAQLVAYALGGTGVIFIGLSVYALTTRKDFSYMGGFLMAGILIAFLAAVPNLFFAMPGVCRRDDCLPPPPTEKAPYGAFSFSTLTACR